MDRYLSALAGLLLQPLLSAQVAGNARNDSLRGKADEIIRRNAHDPALTPSIVAKRLSISLRQLYRAFDGTDGPAARIRKQRLELAAALLAGPSPHEAVDVIAMRCGFCSPEYFSRAFRREYGLSPRAYRSTHGGRRRPRG